jgi:hypothetical protein
MKPLLASVSAIVILSSVVYLLTRTDSSPPTKPKIAQSVATHADSPPALDGSARSKSIPIVPRPVEVPAQAESQAGNKNLHTAFRDLHRCFSNREMVRATKSRADCSFFEGKPSFEKAYAQCLERAQDEVNAMHSAVAAAKGCPTDEGTLISEYYAATKAAARAGNVDAQYCYLFSYFQDSEGRSHYTQQDVEDYKADSPKYVGDALNRGDWRMVSLLSTRFVDPPRSLITLLDDIGQPETIYKTKKLLRLGATGEYAASLDATLSRYQTPAQKAAGDALSREQLAAADKWAQDTYEQHFQGQKLLTEEPRAVCQPTE